MVLLCGGDDGDGNGLDNYNRRGGGGWVVQGSRGGTPEWLLLSFFCCYMTKCAPTKGLSFCRVQWLSVWAAIQFAISLSENTVFSGTRFFRTGSALLRKYTKLIQQGYHLLEMNCGECNLQTWTVLIKEWGRPCLFTLNQRNDQGRKGPWSLVLQGLRSRKTPWRGACITL